MLNVCNEEKQQQQQQQQQLSSCKNEKNKSLTGSE